MPQAERVSPVACLRAPQRHRLKAEDVIAMATGFSPTRCDMRLRVLCRQERPSETGLGWADRPQDQSEWQI
jgi:hypothetical protein